MIVAIFILALVLVIVFSVVSQKRAEAKMQAELAEFAALSYEEKKRVFYGL